MTETGAPPRRGRPSREDAARLKAHLLETATGLFLERGLAVSMDTIATAAGISKRTLYWHFSDKLSLFMAVMSWLSADRTAEALSLPPDLPLREALIRYGAALFEHYTAPRTAAFLRLLQKEKERVPDLERIMRAEVMRDQVLPLKHYLDAQPDGAIRRVDTLQAALLHVRNVIGAIGDEFAEGCPRSPQERRAFLETAADLIALGVAGPANSL